MDAARIQNPEVEDYSLPRLERFLDKMFKDEEEAWQNLEPEVVLDFLKGHGHEVSHRLAAKIKILKFIKEDGVMELLEDPLRVLYATEVLNNEDSVFFDPSFIPHITSLELAYFIDQLNYYKPASEEYPYEFKKVAAYILAEDGFYEPVAPFTFLKKEDLFEGHEEIPETDKELQAGKAKGIATYLKLLRAL